MGAREDVSFLSALRWIDHRKYKHTHTSVVVRGGGKGVNGAPPLGFCCVTNVVPLKDKCLALKGEVNVIGYMVA